MTKLIFVFCNFVDVPEKDISLVKVQFFETHLQSVFHNREKLDRSLIDHTRKNATFFLENIR